MKELEQYFLSLEQSFKDVGFLEFLFNLGITAVLCILLAWFYTRFGQAGNNRGRFARNFLPLGMTTMLIIYIVKASVALSLGLVGALSIVRFRAAIKEPEELTFLFLTIGIGLGAGANEAVIAGAAFFVITGFMFVQHLLRRKSNGRPANYLYLNISTSLKDLQAISETLTGIFPFVELKRMDENKDHLDLAYVVEARDLGQLDQARTALAGLDEGISFSFIEQRDMN